MKPTEARIAVRVSAALKARIAAVEEITGIDEPTLVRSAIDALCAEVQRSGSLRFPLSIRTADPAPLSPSSPPSQSVALNEPGANSLPGPAPASGTVPAAAAGTPRTSDTSAGYPLPLPRPIPIAGRKPRAPRGPAPR